MTHQWVTVWVWGQWPPQQDDPPQPAGDRSPLVPPTPTRSGGAALIIPRPYVVVGEGSEK